MNWNTLFFCCIAVSISPSFTMLIYKDFYTGKEREGTGSYVTNYETGSGDEVCSDSYPMTLKFGGVIMEVSGANVKVDGGIDEHFIDGNARLVCFELTPRVMRIDELSFSAEGGDADAGADDGAVTGINVIMAHKLQETRFSKRDFKVYLKELLKKGFAYVKKQNPDRVNDFKKGAQAARKKILSSFKEWQFYTGESMDPEGLVIFQKYREDGITPYFWYFKDLLVQERI